MSFFKIIQHLLPKGRAWNITPDKDLRKFFEALDFQSERDYFDNIWLDIFPDTTRDIDAWEKHFFGVATDNLTEQERRDRLTATWQQEGGQDPEYIQATLRANGFDVYVHEWWTPGTEAPIGVKRCAIPRNPFLYLRESNRPIIYLNECGEALAQCGEAQAECGESLSPSGYPLVNKIVDNRVRLINLCGEEIAECGEATALCDERELSSGSKKYTIPSDPTKWPYFLYIGGQTFPDSATVDPARKEEFEALCLKICPLQQWLGMLIEYS